jgi:hypothetical protein
MPSLVKTLTHTYGEDDRPCLLCLRPAWALHVHNMSSSSVAKKYTLMRKYGTGSVVVGVSGVKCVGAQQVPVGSIWLQLGQQAPIAVVFCYTLIHWGLYWTRTVNKVSFLHTMNTSTSVAN